ncbi:MAG: LysR family transcriptional regulator [Cyanobacteria bacterium J06648_11]
MKLSQLQALVAVADRGNFSEAALSLNLSQSSVSHAIASLEDELGLPLLTRGRFGARPTPAGEQAIARARQVIRLVETIAREAHSARTLSSGKVRVISFRSASTHLLPPVLAAFQQHHPHIEIDLTESSSYVEVARILREGEADIGISIEAMSEEFQTWVIARDSYVALLPRSRPCPDEVTWADLCRCKFILDDNGLDTAMGSDTAIVRRHWRDHAGKDLQVGYRVKEDSTIVSLVAQGLGAAVMPRLAAQPVPENVRVCPLPTPLERVIVAAMPRDVMQSPAVFAFLDALRGTGAFAE